jgi:hypothetical protein
MNIDSILTEWCYRLPKGYPTSSKDYEVLYNVLLETAEITPEYARDIVEQAKGNIKDIIKESLDIGSIENQFLSKAIIDANKENELEKFLSLLPVEAEIPTLKVLNNLSSDESYEFASLLYSESDVSERVLNTINFKRGLPGRLFEIRPDGLGKGEVLLTILIRDSFIQGGTVSYDLNVNGAKYEVKDYSNPKKPNASIRLGTKGTVTRFRYWDEITATFQRLAQLRGIDSPKFDLDKLLPEPLLEAIRYLDSRRHVILAGNLGMKDKSYLDMFYREANKLSSEIKGYTNVILRGPNAVPIEMSIEPIDDANASGDAFVIRPIRNESQNLTYVNTELRRLKYVRNPSDLDLDMAAAVEAIISDVTFIVFRPNRINVTQDLRYVVTDSGKVRIIEKTIIPDDTNDIEESIEEQY